MFLALQPLYPAPEMGRTLKRIIAARRTFSRFLLPRRLSSAAELTSKPRVLVPPPEIHHFQTGYSTLLKILEACKVSLDINVATAVHCTIFKQGYGFCPSLLSLLMSVYVSCECHSFAHKLHKEVPYPHVDVVSANSIISSFMKIGEIDIAKKIFYNMPVRDVVTWNLLIGGYVKNAFSREALNTFREMLSLNIEPDGFTFASTIAACSRLGALGHAKWVHLVMIEKKIELNYILSAALIDMYAKCGKVDIAKEIFTVVSRTDVSIWNAMINGLAIHGLASDAIAIFSRMEVEKISPDSVTFIGILTACSHCGLVEQGHKYFDLMKTCYLIQPELEHYGVMVDLLGRAGQLEEAFALIKEMNMEPDIVIWRTLLSACRTHRNSELGEVAIGKMSHLGSEEYILLSNIYCSKRKWASAEKVRCIMRNKGLRKSSGKSWVEMNGAIHQFTSGDKSHPDSKLIYRLLEGLIQGSRVEGYISETELVMMDVSEEEKEQNLSYHSEKLGLAYGILRSSPGTEIVITKNLRTCLDCHLWIKIVSKLLNRVITVRDRIRFHRFEGGVCTCRDYW